MFNENGVDIHLASGRFQKLNGPSSDIHAGCYSLWFGEKNKILNFIAEEGYWTLLYILDGEVRINETDVTRHHLVIFNKTETEFT